MSEIFALVDCNNFYASCEKLFRYDLKNTPIVVLSNNDGCVVARSKEAKALGIKMGVPVFQIQDVIQQHNIQVFSSNYALYADLSNRVMRTLESLAPRVEVYSIDEAFLDLTGLDTLTPLLDLGQKIKHNVDQWIGIQVCIGIAPTKTLAKLANHAAKKYPATGGVVDLTNAKRQQRLMAITPVSDIWGVGRKLTKQLEHSGIYTALDLANCPTALIRKQYSIVLERTVRELNGESCLALEEVPASKQQIMCSRSFGSKITRFEQMCQAVTQYTERAAEKLREEQQHAKVLTVFVQTSPFNAEQHTYSNSASGELITPSSDSRDLNQLALQLLKRLWRDGYHYNKAGVMLSDFYSQNTYQADLFSAANKRPQSDKLMQVVDEINQRGLGRIFLARQGINNDWRMKRDYLSPAYTTRWEDIPRVK